MANISNESSFTELLQSCSTNFQGDSLMLAKRGFTADITNGFTVVGSTTTIRFSQLAKHARMVLKDTAPMVMVIMLPLKVVISGRDFSDPAKNAVRIPNELVSRAGVYASSHAIALESTVLIDEMDFRMEDSHEYKGLAPGKVVRLLHSICIRCEDVEYDEFGEPSAIHCSVVSESETTEHAHSIQWVPASTAIPLELRLYNHTFSDAQSTSGELDWSEELSAKNEMVVSTAMADPSLLDWSPLIDKHFRFGQLGYFWLDTDESEAKNQLIFVQTVKLVSESDSQADTAVQSEAQSPVRADEVSSLVSDDNEESGKNLPPAHEVIVPVTNDLPQQSVEEEVSKAKKPKKRLVHVPLPEEAPVASTDSASAAPSAEENDDLSVMERRQAAQLRIDQEKQARLAEIAAFSSGGGPESESLSLTERAELVRRKAEEDNAARLEAEKQAKLAEFLGSNSSGDKLSVTERAALAMRTSAEEERANAELARQAKLAEFLGEDSSPDKLSVADRARLAKLAAEQETQAKLERLRQEKMAEFAQKSTADDGDDAVNSPMLSLAERTERARVKAEQEKAAKLEQEKQAKLEGFLKKDQQSGGAVDSPGGVVDWENMTLAQRRESAKRQAEQDKQARLAEFLKQSSDSSADTPEQPAGSVKDRFENAKKLQAQQEEERLARIKGDPNKRVSIGNAYSDNLSAVNSPVNADSGVTPDNKHRSQGSLKNKWDQSLSETRANKEADRVSTGGAKEERRLSGRTTSLKNVWAEALNESKTTEDNRVRSTKRQTIAQFRVTDGTGIVKKRIGEWEELFMQIAATVEQLEETLKAARLLSLSNSLEGRSIDELKEAQRKFRESCLLPETFIIGATHIYNIKLLDFSVASYIKRSLGDSRAKHFALSCGVYGEAAQPPIEVYAAAIKTDEAYPSYYVALTIKAVEGHELDAEAYGVKKVAIFSKDVNQKILDLIVDIVPQQGWEAWIAEGHYGSESQDSLTPASRRQSSAAPQPETVEEEQEDEPEGDSTVIADDPFLSDVGTAVGGSAAESVTVGESLIDALAAESVEETTESVSETVEVVEEATVDQSSAVEVAADTVVDESGGNVQDTHEQDAVADATESEEVVGTAEEEKAMVEEDGEDKCESEEGDQFAEEPHAPVMNDLDRGSEFEVEPDADDDCAEDVTEPFNYGRTLSVAHVGMARSFMPSPNKKSTFEMSSHTASKFSWSGADEIDEGLPSANLTTVYVDLNDVVTTYSSSNLFVLEGRESSTLFTGTLKSTSTATKYMVHNDKIFQWIRGAAISGWCVKWPMKSQSFGRRSKRFFVLRDNLITYHNRKPEKEDDVLANYSSKNSIVLTEETTVAMTRHYFLRAMTITTPEDTLWIRFRSLRGNEEKETRWRNELQKAIQHQSRKKLFMSKVRVESMWYHESPHISIVAIDALSIGDKYAKVALFCLAETPETAPVAEPVRRSSFSLSKSPTPPPNAARPVMRRSSKGDYEVCTNKFSIDIGASDTERIQLEILRPNESPYLTSNLSCVKIYGDMALFGGAAGFIGIGVIGRTAAAEEAPPRKVMFCVTCNESAAPGSPSSGSPPVSGRKTEHNKSTSSMDGSPTRRLADGPSAFGQNPHHKDATILTFAVGNNSNIFAAADSLGAISIWSLEKSSARSKRHSTESLLEKIRPDFQSSVNLIGMGSSGNHKGQRVIKMHFLPNDTHLVVCTNKRLLLLEISSPVLLGAPQSSPKGFFDMRHGSLSEEHSGTAAAIKGSSFSGADLVLPSQGADPIAPVRVTGWVELDRVAVGCSGVFSMHVEELPASTSNSSNAQETAITTGDSSKGTNDIDSEQAKASEDEQSTAAVSSSAQVPPLLSHHRIVQWKVTEDDDLVSLKPQKSSSKSKLSKCTIYRFEWSPEMLSAALLKMKYI